MSRADFMYASDDSYSGSLDSQDGFYENNSFEGDGLESYDEMYDYDSEHSEGSWFGQQYAVPGIRGQQYGSRPMDTDDRTSQSGEVRPVVCHMCSRSFARMPNLVRHWGGNIDPVQLDCYTCSRQFCSDSALLRHMQDAHGDDPHCCPHCGKSFSSRNGLMSHRGFEPDVLYHECNYCDRSFCSRKSRDQHESSSHGNECEVCNTQFASRRQLENHRGGAPFNARFDCRICGRWFCSARSLMQHADMSHHGFECLRCPICRTSFANLGQLLLHCDGVRPTHAFHCRVCSRPFCSMSRKIFHEQNECNVGSSPDLLEDFWSSDGLHRALAELIRRAQSMSSEQQQSTASRVMSRLQPRAATHEEKDDKEGCIFCFDNFGSAVCCWELAVIL
ncbi:hypothetical protein GUITHDRAFT_92575 [Guillardia theta CCMP2712]|uniref:C2H2-type domain-containing protein n=1 Tax=Guillardia theta (strain CCMP2712) TaxID=905079 RepID=L1JTV2_GUITC|nr:hypothetical protein GUITHDRAFT_92575 [Guillardia theta CCMP2712]EKX51996.1 hypothetical protein GUITHDRAFT_92575 [Guillardia theta CCMP2712]|eukprot:XP_005838976.1 hypothetical protein GUITHDRAFT_92575 [Guillardia theta CCMP2712]